MEVVEEFKEELHSLYNTKLPVSRAKIASVTKLAMKSIKHYKHIVMIVEKFIAKSSAPYKLPALYVIDSIVRQSKHQFNESKEMYGPRFGKRLDKIFSLLYQCTEADKPKIIRVLNLWQKNSVFPSEVLQPLLDQAPPPPSTGSPQEQPSSTQPVLNEAEKKGEEKERKDEQNESLQQDQIDSLLMEQQDQLQSLLNNATTGTDQSGMLVALIDKAKQLQDLQALQQKIMKNSPSEEKGVEGRGGEMKREEITAMDKAKMSQSSMVANEFSKALLDNFDYSSDEEGDVKLPAPAISNDNSDASAIIDQLEEQFKREKEQELVKVSRPSRFHPASPPPPPPRIIDELTPPTSYRAPPIPPPPPPPPPRNLDWRPPPDISRLPPRLPPPPSHLPPPPPPSHLPPSHLPPRMQNSWREEREWSSYSHSHSRRFSRSPSPRRGHFPPPSPPPPRVLPSRSFQRDRSPVHRYERGRRRSEESHYRGDERRDRDSRSRDNEREYESGHFRDRFRDREREPRRHDDDRDHSSREKSRRSRRSSSFSRSGFVTVKSKTVWIGHIIKGVSESQLSSMIEQFGKIKSIDFILARGCAYVVMETRDAAKKVVEDLKDPRVLGQKCKVAWAPGRGAKGQTFDRYWDAAVGVSVIPWEHVKSRSEVETLSNGGMVETSTLPPQLKEEVTEVDMED